MTFGMTTRAFGAAALVAGMSLATAACGRDEPATETTATPPAATDTASTARTDAQIGTEVQAKFYSDDQIRGRRVDVEAENGVVTLRGTVPDDAAKQQAVNLARSVEGVTHVNDELQVRTETAAATTERRTPDDTAGTTGTESRNPGWITTKIQAQYFVNPEIKPWNIDVNTGSGGVVTLEGTVDSNDDKSEAVRIARNTEGVTRVEDRLRVDSNAAREDRDRGPDTQPERDADPNVNINIDRPDAWLTAKIQSKYFIDDEVKGRRIDVDTSNGVVTLNGTVASEAEKRQAIALAQNTDGVRDVQDNLRVDASMRDRDMDRTRDTDRTRDADRTRDPNTTIDDRARRTAADIERPDVWITTKVQAKYFLDADVKGHEINVDTNNGVVTLKGSVDTAQQKQEAEQIARETEGVKRVVNQLTIEKAGA